MVAPGDRALESPRLGMLISSTTNLPRNSENNESYGSKARGDTIQALALFVSPYPTQSTNVLVRDTGYCTIAQH